jgi:LacI family transcriptional regulator
MNGGFLEGCRGSSFSRARRGAVTSRSPLTIKALAAQLGLAHSTVSRALAGHASISAETRARVQEIARELGYIPNSGARLLRMGHSPTVGLIVPNTTNEFYASVAQILAEECSERGRPLVLAVSEDDPQRELSVVQALLSTRPSALIVTLTGHPQRPVIEHLQGLPVVQFLRENRRIHAPAVTIDDVAGGRLAAEHLLELGHTRFGFLGVPEILSTGAARLRGFQSTLASRGIALPTTAVKLVRPDLHAGASAFAELLRTATPTAVFVASPQLAVGAAQVLHAQQVRVPGDLSVVAYGNSTWFKFFGQGLTAVSLPLQQLATAATSLLFRTLKHPGEEVGEGAMLAPLLVRRGSTALARD